MRQSAKKKTTVATIMRSLESPLDCKEIQPVHPKGNQSWIVTWGTHAEAETPILGPPDAKSWLIGKDPDAGKDWGQKKGTTEDEMVGWHHWLNGHEFEETPGDSGGDMSLSKLWELVMDRGLLSMGSQRVRHDWLTEQQLSWKHKNAQDGMAGSLKALCGSAVIYTKMLSHRKMCTEY